MQSDGLPNSEENTDQDLSLNEILVIDVASVAPNLNRETSNPNSETINLNSEAINRDSETINLNSETSNPENETNNPNSETINPDNENVNLNSDHSRGIPQRALEELPSALDWEEVSSEASDAINNVVENIVDRMRIERMFELRRIQHGDRAVSSGETAQRLEELFSSSTTEATQGTPHRSEIVRNELEELARNQSVGNLLNTRFRTMLENSLSTPPQGPAPVRSRATTTAPPEDLPRAPSSHRSFAASASVPFAPPVPRPEQQTPDVEIDDPARQAALAAAQQYQPPDLSGRQFDYAISDVEELFQRRLVSDVLHSAFRNVLELHIERRLVRSGAPRQFVSRQQRQQQQQPPSQPIQRPQQQQQQQPPSQPTQGASVNPFRVSQHVPSMSQASSSRRLPEIERQIHTMSAEMKEMKGMIKLLVDTQLDIQRSIRQEVNALMKSSTITPAAPTPLIKDGTCVVCLEVACDTVLYRCGHLCCCFNCARSLRVAGHHCPVCRAEVTDILRIYKSTNE